MTSRAMTVAAIVALATAFTVQDTASAETRESQKVEHMRAPHEKAPAAAQAELLAKDHAKVITNDLAESYTFTLNSFKITDTRSVHNDTDFVSIAVAVGTNPAITLPAKPLGDVNNGTHQVNMSIPVTVRAGDKVTFSYSIVNTGHDQDKVAKELGPLVGQAAQKGTQAAVIAVGDFFGIDPKTASFVGSLAGSWASQIQNVVFANCDGPVAAGTHSFTGGALMKLTSNGRVFSATDDNKGQNSPVGCGSNSRYYVTWSVSAPGSSAPQISHSGGSGGPIDRRHHVQN